MLFRKINRKKFVKTIFWIIVIFVIPSFFFFGIGSAIKGRDDLKYAGKIFGKDISIEDYLKNIKATKTILYITNRKAFESFKTELDYSPLIWQRIMFLYEAKRRKVSVSDDEVINAIKNIFKTEGQEFDTELYKHYIKNTFSIPERKFEEYIRDVLLIEKLFEEVKKAVVIDDAQLEERYKKDNERTTITYIQIDSNELLAQVTDPSDEEIKKYYDENIERFSNLVQLNIQYTGTDFNVGATDEEKEAVIKKFNDIRDAMGDSTDLEKITKDNSLTLRETGLFLLDEPVPEIGDVVQFKYSAFFLKPGDISRPVKIDKGCYILKLKEKKEDYKLEFEQAKAKIKDMLKKEKSRELAQKNTQELFKKINEKFSTNKDADFNEVVKEFSLIAKLSTEFSRETTDIPDIGYAGNLTKTAFELKDGQISEPLELNGKFFILKRNAIIPADLEKFKTDKETYREKILESERQASLERFMSDLTKEANLTDNIPLIFSENQTKKASD